MKTYSNVNYYKNLASEGKQQFDFIEPTIAYLFRFPTPALQGLSYGAAFCKEVLERKILTDDHKFIVEVGGGLGDFAYDFLAHLYKEKKQRPYLIIDVSSDLQEKQKAVLKDFPNVFFHLADAHSLPFADKELNALVISNEVIADFDAVEFLTEEWNTSKEPDIELLHEHPPPKENVLFNSGAIKFIKELDRVLSDSGTAVITEHGLLENARVTVTGRPTSPETSHLEFSINWKHLCTIAQHLGFSYDLIPLIDFLNFDKQLEVTNFNDARALKQLYEDFPIAAIPASELAKILNINITDIKAGSGLRLPQIGGQYFPDDNTLPFSHSFQAFILKRS